VAVQVAGIGAPQLRSFARFAPQIMPVPYAQVVAMIKAGANGQWAIQSRPGPTWAPQGYASLDAAMARVNFNPHGFISGAATAFQDGGHTWALPYAVRVVGVQYRPEAFSATGIPPPSADWTLEDFETACAGIAACMRRGRLPQYAGVLPALGYAAAVETAVWDGLAHGFGGTLAAGGRYTLGNPGALAGFSRVLQLWARYGTATVSTGDAGAYVAQPTRPQPPGTGSAMAFTLFDGTDAPGAGWRLARFPVLPRQPVVPVRVLGAFLGYWSNDHGIADFVSLDGIDVPQAATEAVVELALWQRQTQTAAPAQSGFPPAIADASAQAAYWQEAGTAHPGARALGDWQHYLPTEQGWPPIDGNPYTVLLAALKSAASDPPRVAGALQKAENRLNLMVAQYAADMRQAVAARRERASVASSFPTAGPSVASGSTNR